MSIDEALDALLIMNVRQEIVEASISIWAQKWRIYNWI
jgi:hypothetical protein